MGAYVMTGAQLLLGSTDISAFTGEFTTEVSAVMVERNNMAALGYGVVIPAAVSGMMGFRGYADYASGAVSSVFGSAAKGQQTAATIIPIPNPAVAIAAGDAAMFTRGVLTRNQMAAGGIGAATTYSIDLTSDSAEIDGVVAATLASRTTAGLTGTSLQLGAVPTGKRLWAALHVTAVTGTNLVVTIESDNATGFPSPATQITFSTMSATGWQFAYVDGPITDDWFRAKATIATGTFTFAVAMGVF